MTRTFYGTIGRFVIGRTERELRELAVRNGVNLETERTPRGMLNFRLRVSITGDEAAVDNFMHDAMAKWEDDG